MGSVNLDYLATGKYTSLDLAIGMTLRDFSLGEHSGADEDDFVEEVQKIYGHSLSESEEIRIKDVLQGYQDKCRYRESRYFEDIEQKLRIPRALRIQRLANIWLRKKKSRANIQYSVEKDAYRLSSPQTIEDPGSDWYGPNGLAGNCNIFEFLPPANNFFPLVLIKYCARQNGTLKFKFSCVFVHGDGSVNFYPRWGTMRREGFTWVD